MYSRIIKPIGDDLHWLCMLSVVPNHVDPPFTGHYHLMPTEQKVVRKRLGEAQIDIDFVSYSYAVYASGLATRYRQRAAIADAL